MRSLLSDEDPAVVPGCATDDGVICRGIDN